MDGRPDDAQTGQAETPTGRLADPPARPGAGSRPLDVEVEGLTHPGQVRDHNEDSFGVESPTSARARAHGTLLVVSDGMGGHAAGEVASGMAVETIPAAFYREQAGRTQSRDTGEVIVEAILAANTAIYDEAERTPERLGMGCTVVAAVVQGNDLTVGHVGDSRIYLIRGGQIRQLTRDHSWIAQQVAAGVLTPEQAEHHPRRSLLLQALGREPTVQVDVAKHPLEAGDVVLLCSDGLTGVVHDPEIADLVTRLAPRAAVERLIALANERGAPDNVTVVVAAIDDTATERLPAAAPVEVEGPVTERAIIEGPITERATIQPPAGQPPPRPHDTVPMAASAGSAGPPPRRDRPATAGSAPHAQPAAAPAPAPARRPRWPLWVLAVVSLLALVAVPFLIQPSLITGLGERPAPTSAATVAARPAATPNLPSPIPTGLPGFAASPAAAVSPTPAAPATPPPTSTVTATPTSPPAPAAAPAPPDTPTPTPTEPTATPTSGPFAPVLPTGLPPIPTGIPGLPPGIAPPSIPTGIPRP